MSMLAAYLHVQEQREAWQAYEAQMLWHLNSVICKMVGTKFEHPTWLEIAHPAQKDSRSGAEIVDDVKAMLLDRAKRRKGE